MSGSPGPLAGTAYRNLNVSGVFAASRAALSDGNTYVGAAAPSAAARPCTGPHGTGLLQGEPSFLRQGAHPPQRFITGGGGGGGGGSAGAAVRDRADEPPPFPRAAIAFSHAATRDAARSRSSLYAATAASAARAR